MSYTPNFTPYNVKLGVFVLFRFIRILELPFAIIYVDYICNIGLFAIINHC